MLQENKPYEKSISEYTFHEFLEQFQKAILEGYRLDLASNERFPQRYGSHLAAILVLEQEGTQEVVTEVQPEVKLDVDKPAEVVQVGALEGTSNGITSEDIPVAQVEVKTKGRKAKG
jgi:hypothetical protein